MGIRHTQAMTSRDPLRIPVLAANAAPRHPVPRRDHTSPWQWSWLLAAPHRLGFFSAACVFAASALWWAAVMLARTMALPLPWAVVPGSAHASLMVLGFMPLFMVGFLFTAGPKWLALPEVDARTLKQPVSAVVAGWTLALPGFHTGAPLVVLGLALVALGWSGLTWRFIGLIRISPAPDQLHARLVAAACTIGALGLWTSVWGFAADADLLVRSATQVALWGFVAPVFAVVSHRMLPFFTAAALPMLDAWRPDWLAWVMVLALWVQAPLAVADIWLWPQPAVVYALRALLEAAMAALLLYLAVRWGLLQSLRIRLLAMLHAAFLWLGLAFALNAVSHAMLALTQGQQSLGLAPTHALTMGYLGGSLLAMVTRVSSGHSGRPLAADNPVWLMYGLLHIAALARVAAALWPAATEPLLLSAAALWAGVALGWSVRFGNWFGRIRVDGKPG